MILGNIRCCIPSDVGISRSLESSITWCENPRSCTEPANYFFITTKLLLAVSSLFVSQSWPLLPTHSRCRDCLFSLDHSQTHTTVGRTCLDKGSARCRDLYLTTQTHSKRQTSMTPVGFEPTIPASAQPQTYIWDCAATGFGLLAVASF
jgi:hypothetical protein